MEKPEHFNTEREARARALELAPDAFPDGVCIVHRPDKDGKWHVCTEGQASGRYKDAKSVVAVSNDGTVDLVAMSASADIGRHRRKKEEDEDGGVGVRKRSRCKGCLRKLDRSELYKIPGRKGRFCMTCATQFVEQEE